MNKVVCPNCERPVVALDLEYTIPELHCYMAGLYAPWAGTFVWWEGHEGSMPREEFGVWLADLAPKVCFLVQNSKAEGLVLPKNFGIDPLKECYNDTLLMHSVLWSEMNHGLGLLMSIYGEHAKTKHLSASDPLLYNCGDVWGTYDAYLGMMKEFQNDLKNPGYQVYRSELIPLIPIILRMEERGIPVNKEFITTAFETASRNIEWANRLGRDYSGFPINLDSSSQMAGVLVGLDDVYGKGRPKGGKVRMKRTAGGAVSLNDEALTELKGAFTHYDADADDGSIEFVEKRLEAGGHPLIEARSFYIANRQGRSSYLYPLLKNKNGSMISDKQRKELTVEDLHDLSSASRIHADFKPWGQATGRWSTTGRDKWEMEVGKVGLPLAQLPYYYRDLLGNDKGWPELHFDFDQQELRLLAALAGDTSYLGWFRRGYDPHTLAACDFFDYPYPPEEFRSKGGIYRAEETAEWREQYGFPDSDCPRRGIAKVGVYRMAYRGQLSLLANTGDAKRLGLDAKQLGIAETRWRRAHPEVVRYWSEIDEEVMEHNLVRTPWGRMRYLMQPNHTAKLREAANFPMQAMGAQMMNRVVLGVAKLAEEYPQFEGRPACYPMWTMHDAVHVAMWHELEDELRPRIEKVVEGPWTINGVDVEFPAEFHRREMFV